MRVKWFVCGLATLEDGVIMSQPFITVPET
jgi:hypothetical protein